MSSLLHQLENNEAILHLYLADELPAEDRAEVEAMLQVDPGLRQQLEQLRETLEQVEEGLAALDGEPRPSRQERVLRRVSRMMEQWAMDRLTATELPEEETVRRFPLWGYPVATAAAVGLLLLLWWQALPDNPGAAPMYMGGVSFPGMVNPEIEILADSFAEGGFREDYVPFEQMERELAALQAVDNYGWFEDR